MFAPSQSFIVKDGALQKAGYILDIKKALSDLGVADQMLPGAQAVIDQLYPGVSPTLPFQYNVEGIFYNKKMFAASGISVPKTWDELVAAATKLKAAVAKVLLEEGFILGYRTGKYVETPVEGGGKQKEFQEIRAVGNLSISTLK